MLYCKSNVQAAFVLGIVLTVLSILSCIADAYGGVKSVTTGVIFAFINVTLIFGAYKRHITAILIWMILALIQCIIYGISHSNLWLFLMDAKTDICSKDEFDYHCEASKSSLRAVAITAITMTILTIFTIFVATKARKEIQGVYTSVYIILLLINVFFISPI